MRRTYKITYMDADYRTHEITTDNIIEFYQRVQLEGLTVVKLEKQ